eukprot:1572220-Amphidinium_carterae.1
MVAERLSPPCSARGPLGPAAAGAAPPCRVDVIPHHQGNEARPGRLELVWLWRADAVFIQTSMPAPHQSFTPWSQQ